MKKYRIAVLLILATLFSFQPVFAQTDEEFETLQMYYKEEDIAVVSATRFPKLKSQVAENITVITKQAKR